MTVPLLWTFALVCVFLLAQGMLSRGAIYGYPFLAGSVFTGFVLPQLIGLSGNRFLPPGSVDATLIMVILCAVMCWIGAAMAKPSPVRVKWLYDDRRLLWIGAALSLIGGYFYYAISRLPPELTETTQWTGLPVAYLFFARLLTYGFAIATLLYARNGSLVALLVALYGASFYLYRIVIAGRRHDTIEFVLIIALAWWFQRNRCIPRPIMLLGALLGALFVNSAGDYRAATGQRGGPNWDQVSEIDFLGNIERLTTQGGAELTNAAYIIAAVDRTMEFDLGVSHWNALVFSYVPAQLVGSAIKEALYLPMQSPVYDEFFYTPELGSTLTGFSDAFASFWYFGCLKFFVIAFCMQAFWWKARAGGLVSQLLYMLLPVGGMEAITHGTQNFISPLVHMAIFLLPALYLARRSPTKGRDLPESAKPIRAAPYRSASGADRSHAHL